MIGSVRTASSSALLRWLRSRWSKKGDFRWMTRCRGGTAWKMTGRLAATAEITVRQVDFTARAILALSIYPSVEMLVPEFSP
jgi:hypothetical protein